MFDLNIIQVDKHFEIKPEIVTLIYIKMTVKNAQPIKSTFSMLVFMLVDI